MSSKQSIIERVSGPDSRSGKKEGTDKTLDGMLEAEGARLQSNTDSCNDDSECDIDAGGGRWH